MLGNRQQTELAYSLMFSFPGTPVIRYGDEIGMGDNLELTERDAVRTPMQWSGEKNGGFSKGERLIHPVVTEGYYAYEHVNVDRQRRDSGSLLNWMTALIRIRKECPEIGCGNWEIMETGFDHILGIRYTWKAKTLLIWHNFEEKSIELIVPEKQAGTRRLIDVMNNIESVLDEKGRHTITLEAYGYRWFRAEPE
jgi:maltose alpha-D-glucosyltransferase/alpha-amylase